MSSGTQRKVHVEVLPRVELFLGELAALLRLDDRELRRIALGLAVDFAADAYDLGEQAAYERPTVETPMLEGE